MPTLSFFPLWWYQWSLYPQMDKLINRVERMLYICKADTICLQEKVRHKNGEKCWVGPCITDVMTSLHSAKRSWREQRKKQRWIPRTFQKMKLLMCLALLHLQLNDLATAVILRIIIANGRKNNVIVKVFATAQHLLTHVQLITVQHWALWELNGVNSVHYTRMQHITHNLNSVWT